MLTKRKNLLIIGPTMGTYGGLESFMIALAKAASSWPEFNVRLAFKPVSGVVVNKDLKCMSVSENYSVYFITRGSKELMRLVIWADVLHVQNTPPDVIFPARLLMKKIFLTIHNWRRKSWRPHNIVWAVAAKMANRRWYNSKFVWNTWESERKSALSDCIPTVSVLPVVKTNPLERKGFLFVGRWIENKGLEEIVEAYAICKPDSNKWPLILLGDGPLRNEIVERIKTRRITGVYMPGFVDEERKEKLMASAKWLLAPAKTREDLGLTPIEARNLGVPSIVTMDGGLPEAAGEAGLIAEPGNIIDLARCMTIAMKMSNEEYISRSELAFTSLNSFLKPMDFYRNAYIGE